MRRPGQHDYETAIEYLRRVVSNCSYEHDSLLAHLPSVEAVCDYVDLWAAYDTEFWTGVIDSISDGLSPQKALDFVAKHNLGNAWRQDVEAAASMAVD